MARLPRFNPDNNDGVLVEVTARTIGAQALLVPAPAPRRFNEIVIGVMGRALEVSPLELCAAVVLANHLHLLVVVHEQQELSRLRSNGCRIAPAMGFPGGCYPPALPYVGDPPPYPPAPYPPARYRGDARARAPKHIPRVPSFIIYP